MHSPHHPPPQKCSTEINREAEEIVSAIEALIIAHVERQVHGAFGHGEVATHKEREDLVKAIREAIT